MTATDRPVSADFPVCWRQPSDAEWLWTQDRAHYPDPVTPLEFCLIEDGVDAGLTKSARAYEIPITLHDRHINSYLYTSVETTELPAADAAASAQRSQAKLESAMACLRATWDGTWLPEIQEHLDWWSALALDSATGAVLLHHLTETERRWQRLWEIHFLLFVPSKLAISEFVDLYQDLFENTDPFEPYRMLAGLATKTLQSGQALWALSRQILASPPVMRIFSESAVDAVLPRLRDDGEGRRFLAALDAYLAEHGHRADKVSLDYPYWVEDPTPVLATLSQYVQQADRDLDQEIEHTRSQREGDVALLRSRLADFPRAVRQEVEVRLRAAQEGTFLGEEHGHWIDYKAGYCVRRVLLAIGARLAADGVLADAADLFYLQMAEVKDLMASTDPHTLYDTQLKARVALRRATADHFATVAAPEVLGARGDGAITTAGRRDPISEMFHKVEGAVATESSAGVLVGIPGSPGLVEGTVKVVHLLHEGAKLQPGDILVAETTSPPWTLLFATIGGLVTDSGGILSHSAVVAREYRVPAVVGAGEATRRLHDGQRVAVDGTRGTVRILE